MYGSIDTQEQALASLASAKSDVLEMFQGEVSTTEYTGPSGPLSNLSPAEVSAKIAEDTEAFLNKGNKVQYIAEGVVAKPEKKVPTKTIENVVPTWAARALTELDSSECDTDDQAELVDKYLSEYIGYTHLSITVVDVAPSTFHCFKGHQMQRTDNVVVQVVGNWV